MREEIAIKNLREVKEIFDKLGIKYWLDWGTLLGAMRNGKIIEWDTDIDLGTMSDSLKKIISAFPELERRRFDVYFEQFKFHKILKTDIAFDRLGCPISVNLYQVKGENAFMISGRPTNMLTGSTNLISRGLRVLYCLLLSQRPGVRPKLKFIVRFLKHCLSLLPPESKRPLSDVVLSVWGRIGLKFDLVVVPKHYFRKLETIKFYGMTFNIPSNFESYLKYHYGENWKTPKRDWISEKEDGTIKVLTAQWWSG